MKICILSYEYRPFPGGGIATYHNAAARILAAAGHEVHVVTNAARHGSQEPDCTYRRFQQGNLHTHRIWYFDERRETPANAQFLDLDPNRYSDRARVWAREPSNQAAHKAMGYLAALHREVGLDVIESPEFFAEAYYVIRRRQCGEAHRFPPVCVHGHISSRFAFGHNEHVWELGWYPHRQMMLREEYCLQHADALLTPSHALMQRYVDTFGPALPELRETLPYFLELPEGGTQLPDGLNERTPFLVTLGRIEPRKGSDLAMAAFNRLADDHPELKLVFLGKPLWHQGESVDDVVAAHVDARHRHRVLRLGNVPREQALAATRAAQAFLHPVPWDNYPCAVLEAMGMGAACVVSDQGGQAEMVEHEQSGLVHPAGDVEALTAQVRRMLDDTELAARLRDGARDRVRQITDEQGLLQRKQAFFEQIADRERRQRAGDRTLFQVPENLRSPPQPPALPAAGLVVVDCAGADTKWIEATASCVQTELSGSPDWRVAAFVDADQDVDLPPAWQRFHSIHTPPWLAHDGDAPVVWMRAGVRLDVGRLGRVVAQLVDARTPCGSFAWLRPRDARAFPYPPDFGWQDGLIGGRMLAPVFGALARDFAHARFLSGLLEPAHRLAALPAAIAAGSGLMFQHTGTICGDFYDAPMFVDEDTQYRALGFLDVLRLAPRELTVIGNWPIPMAPTADLEKQLHAAREEGRKEGRSTTEREAERAGNAPRQASPQPGSRTPADPVADDGMARVDPYHLAELEKVYREHNALKQMRVVRWLRKAGTFGAVRRLFPKSRRAFGPGH